MGREEKEKEGKGREGKGTFRLRITTSIINLTFTSAQDNSSLGIVSMLTYRGSGGEEREGREGKGERGKGERGKGGIELLTTAASHYHQALQIHTMPFVRSPAEEEYHSGGRDNYALLLFKLLFLLLLLLLLLLH